MSSYILFVVLCSVLPWWSSGRIDKPVTYGSLFKLYYPERDVRLHSHDVEYSTGSRAQSVTGIASENDVGSHWTVEKFGGEPWGRGEPVRCGDEVVLRHAGTGKCLASLDHGSPLSGQREVSALKEGDSWLVGCGGGVWRRGEHVTLRHGGSSSYLCVTDRKYGNPIGGQLEVVGGSEPCYWKSAEGLYIGPTSDQHQHEEL